MKIHPLLKLAASEPHLLGDHVEAYAALMGEEVKKVSTSVALRIGLYAGAGMLALVGLILLGVALLLRASIPSGDYPAGWALIVVPLAPFVIGAAMVFVARAQAVEKPFDTIKAQLNADMAMLREVSGS
jgi:hypothetical protein